jgi:hypothetical protein
MKFARLNRTNAILKEALDLGLITGRMKRAKGKICFSYANLASGKMGVVWLHRRSLFSSEKWIGLWFQGEGNQLKGKWVMSAQRSLRVYGLVAISARKDSWG